MSNPIFTFTKCLIFIGFYQYSSGGLKLYVAKMEAIGKIEKELDEIFVRSSDLTHTLLISQTQKIINSWWG
jgi:hypothetical protein